MILEIKIEEKIIFGNIISLITCNTSEYCNIIINVYNKAVNYNTYPEFER